MPSIEETRRQQLADERNTTLASRLKDLRQINGKPDKSPKTSPFRFKDGTEPKKRKHPSRHGADGEDGEEDASGRKHMKEPPETDQADDDTAHPFPREPTNPDHNAHQNSNAAFRESLFDALADDEGAAYWESVYSQPIHTFPRPAFPNASGELEAMSDDEYAAHVQTKMWEKKNPHVVLERERKEKQRKEEEEERVRQRDEFVRRKQQKAAWERFHKRAKKFAGLDDDNGGNDDDHEFVFEFEDMKRLASKYRTTEEQEIHEAWKRYLAEWDRMKREMLLLQVPERGSLDAEQPSSSSKVQEEKKHLSTRIPWPVLASKPVIKENIVEFMRHMPLERDGPVTREHMLKAERVKWHPDKVQQRFGGEVDEGTMKLVTGVFQVVDALLDAERKRR
jgi:hypothetical protein